MWSKSWSRPQGLISAYEQMVSEAQHQFLAQTELLMKSLSWLLPFSGKHRPDRD